MSVSFVLEALVVLGAIVMGTRAGGVGVGLWGGLGTFVLVFVFGEAPGEPPAAALAIILAVVTTASMMQAAGGIDWMVSVAAKVIEKHPKQITLIAPLTAFAFSIGAGTSNIIYPLLPVIYETAHQAGIRPERPMAVATIASQQAITASPVAAATAAMIGLFAEKGLTQWGLPQVLVICVPATLSGVIVAAIVSTFLGKDLADDATYQARLKAGEVPPVKSPDQRAPLESSARTSALMFLAGVALVVVAGFFPTLRTLPGQKSALDMPLVIEIVMMSAAALMLLATKVEVDAIPKTATLRAGVVAVIGIFGLAWMGDSFISANKDVILPAIGQWARAAPWTFAFGLFFASVLLYSQAATTRALMPLGMALGIPPQFLIAMFPSVNGYFLIPTYGSLIAAINFDLSGTTRIGKYVLNHSFMIPGLVATATAVFVGLILARVIY